VETGSAREVHHFALLAGYGAEAVHPYLAMETLADMARACRATCRRKGVYNFIKAIGKGLHKVMSKMGISTYMSYWARRSSKPSACRANWSQVLHGTPSNVEGIGVFEVAEEALRLHRDAFGDDPVLANMLDAGGEYAFRVRGEEHMWTPDAIAKLQHSAPAQGKYQTYKEYAQIINDQSKRHMTLRGLFEFKVDPARGHSAGRSRAGQGIVKRFATGAMSLGSISTEAHTTLAVAMNRIGGKSNTGEGGEDEKRYRNELRGIPIKQGDTLKGLRARRDRARPRTEGGDSLRSKIKQVASGRFGVTAEYLARPTRSRSRWPRAPSRAKAASCPATRCPTSASCVTRCRAWA
jgi:glutamate synthase (NADPH/NADH) large chain